jgi:ABC-type phosphate transport system substrate-binding protein
MNKMIRRNLSIVFALLVLAPSLAWSADYQVIVNVANPTDILSRAQVVNIFLKKTPRWDTGTPVVPVDQAPASSVREVFTQVVHGKAVGAVASYWQQQIFAGRAVPPAEKSGDAAVIAFVKRNPGAIGYITAGADAEGVKLLSVR